MRWDERRGAFDGDGKDGEMRRKGKAANRWGALLVFGQMI